MVCTSPGTFRLIPVLFLLFRLFSADQGSTPEANTIKEVCDRATYADLCVSALRSDPRSSDATYKSLVRISIEFAETKGTDTYSYLSELLKKTKNDDFPLQTDLSYCVKVYQADVVKGIGEAIREFDADDYQGAASFLSACVGAAVSCESKFKDQPTGESPFKDRAQLLERLCIVAADLVLLFY